MPFINDPNRSGQFDPSKMTGEEQEVYGKVMGRAFLLLEALKELDKLNKDNNPLAGMVNSGYGGIIVRWEIAERR